MEIAESFAGIQCHTEESLKAQQESLFNQTSTAETTAPEETEEEKLVSSFTGSGCQIVEKEKGEE